MTRFGWFALLMAVMTAVLIVCIVAVAEPMPQLYPDAEEFLTAGGAAGDLKMLGHDIYTDADSDSRWEHGTDDQIGLWLNAAGPQCLVTTAAATWTVQAIFSGVTADITTATNEHLQLAPNGTGDLLLGTDADTFVVTNTNETLTVETAGAGNLDVRADADSELTVGDGTYACTAGRMCVEPNIEAEAEAYLDAGVVVSGSWARFNGFAPDITTTAGEDLTLDPAGAGSTEIITDHSSGSEVKLSTVAAGNIVGPLLQMSLADGTPVAEDILGGIQWYGQDSTPATQHYGSMYGVSVDPTATSEDFRLDTWAYVGGAEKKVQELGMTTQGWGQSLWYGDDGALGPTLGFTHSSTTPLAADVLGRVIWAGKDSGAADQEYVRIEAINVDPTVAGGEDGRLDIKPFVAGAQATTMSIGAVPDYTGALVQGVALQNGGYFRNTAAGDVCIGTSNVGATNPEDLCFDFDYTSNTIQIKSGGSAASELSSNVNIRVQDDVGIRFGSATDGFITHSTAQTTDSMLIAPGSESFSVLMTDRADTAVDFTFPAQTTPTLVIQNQDATAPTKRIWIQHDGTDGKIEVGSGGLKAALPTITEAGTNDYSLIVNQTLNDTVAAGGTQTYDGLKISVTTTDTTGWDNIYALSVYDDAVKTFHITNTGVVRSASITMNDASAIGWSGRSGFASPADGQIRLTNNAGTDFDDLEFGVAASATFPEFHITDGAVPSITLRQSDGSGAADFVCEGSIKSGTYVSNAGDPADAGVVRLGNAESVCWEADATGTDVCMSVGADETLATTGGAGASFSTNTGSKAVEIKDTTTGATTGMYVSCELVSCDGDTGIDGGDIIVDGALLIGVSTYVQTALTLAAGAGYTVGDGSDADLYGVEAASIVGSATALRDVTAVWTNPQLAASDVHVTFPGNCSAGAVRICAHQLGGTGPGA